MLRKHKRYNRPRKPFDISRIKSENSIVIKYGLKNKLEIWKVRTKLDGMRRRAKMMVNEDQEKQKEFLYKLNKLGFKLKNVVDVLALTEEDVLKRRLQSVILNNGLATTARGARQLITHKHILVNGKIVNIPSYIVEIDKENKIELFNKTKVNGLEIEETKVKNIEESIKPKTEFTRSK